MKKIVLVIALALIAASSLMYNYILSIDIIIYKEHINVLNKSLLFVADSSQVARKYLEAQRINHELKLVIERKDSIINSLSKE